jgi:hypothetical protein
MKQTYTGGCQCGAVRYEVAADINEVIINVRCLDGLDLNLLKAREVDGRKL